MPKSPFNFHEKTYDRIIRLIQKHLGNKINIPFELQLQTGRSYYFGTSPPLISFTVNDRSGLAALCSFDELKFCEAYISGSLDIEGDMFQLPEFRKILTDRHPLHYLLSRMLPMFIGQVHSNQKAIANHYEYDEDFFLTFMDSSRCYSQAVFERDDEPLETAQQRKLAFALDACRVKPGERILDVGGGWGAFTEFAGKQGLRVTSLTISRQSEQYLKDLIQRIQLPCQVLFQDFFEHVSPEPYDAIVILGVMEHLSNYRAVIKQFRKLLKPGGRIYLDASAFREKYSKPTFISRYIFPGNHSYFCLHDFVTAVEETEFEVLAVHNDRYSYFLTCKVWAENLDAARDEIIRRWGDRLYRSFRLYLWGSAHAFSSHGLEAFRVILERPLLSGS
ncbi:MAG: class I SAM-dependent methyltransferase [Desulfuromonadaceae bacterium]|nr:class I SAM-dependent methyltransferase [Desulfuromonadaceae bacterium]MDD2849234.1 class I SAM-dependent methyltransferase [Desulfuromonadaceae bacterium]MDD4129717.1 class I SAM-dependent methyltransferase [Desulfuromonadaceae bacterium]